MNQSKKFILFLVVAIILAVGLIEVVRRQNSKQTSENNSTQNKSSFPREITDSSGAKLIIKEKPQRIVSQMLGTDEILLAICEPQRIAALHKLVDDPKYSPVTEEAKQIKGRVASEVEPILQLKPDLVFVASFSRAELVDLLKAANAPVFRFANFDKIDDIKTNIRTVGFAIGEEEKAEKLVAQMEEELKKIKAEIPKDAPKPRVISFGLSGGSTAGKDTLFDDVLNFLGAINAATENGVNSYTNISTEQLTKWNPDVIVASTGNNDFETVKKNYLDNPAIAATNAGKNKRIIVIPSSIFLSVTHNQVKAIKQLAQELYQK